MKFIFSFFAYLFFLNMYAQDKPQYVPFKFNGKTGIMYVSGKEYKEPGYLNEFENYYLAGDFQSYIIHTEEDSDIVMDATAGKELFTGNMDTDCGQLKVGNNTYYHFRLAERSALLASGKTVINLDKSYLKIEPNSSSWDNENLNDDQFIWALKEDGTYDILDGKKKFAAVKGLPNFESFDLIFRTNNGTPPTLAGFALGKKTAIIRSFGQQYGISQSDEAVEIYDIHLKKIGSVPYREDRIAKLFNTGIQLRGRMIAPPGVKNETIRSNNKIIVLNQEFSLIPEADKLVLVNTKKNSLPILGNDKFDYRYISTSKNSKALLQIRHSESGSFFYFDFDGIYFPKGIPMIPEKYQQWK